MLYNNDRSDVLISIDKSNVDNGGELGPKRQLLLIAVNKSYFLLYTWYKYTWYNCIIKLDEAIF